MLEYIKARLRVWFNKETQEMNDHVALLIPVMLEWVSYYRKYDCKN